MKRLPLTLLLLCGLSLAAHTQDPAPMSEAEKISTKAGALVETQFVDIGTVRGVDVNLMVVKSLTDQSTTQALRVSYTKVTQYTSDTKISVLDKDEID